MQQMKSPPDDRLESALRREVLRSERRRVLWQAGVLTGVLAAMLLARAAAPEMQWSGRECPLRHTNRPRADRPLPAHRSSFAAMYEPAPREGCLGAR